MVLQPKISIFSRSWKLLAGFDINHEKKVSIHIRNGYIRGQAGNECQGCVSTFGVIVLNIVSEQLIW